MSRITTTFQSNMLLQTIVAMLILVYFMAPGAKANYTADPAPDKITYSIDFTWDKIERPDLQINGDPNNSQNNHTVYVFVNDMDTLHHGDGSEDTLEHDRIWGGKDDHDEQLVRFDMSTIEPGKSGEVSTTLCNWNFNTERKDADVPVSINVKKVILTLKATPNPLLIGDPNSKAVMRATLSPKPDGPTTYTWRRYMSDSMSPYICTTNSAELTYIPASTLTTCTVRYECVAIFPLWNGHPEVGTSLTGGQTTISLITTKIPQGEGNQPPANPHPCPVDIGCPINVMSQTYYNRVTDVSIPTKYGLNLNIERFYSSRFLINQAYMQTNSLFGYGPHNHWLLSPYELVIDNGPWDGRRILHADGSLNESTNPANILDDDYVEKESYDTLAVWNGYQFVHFGYREVFKTNNAVKFLPPDDANNNRPLWIARFMPLVDIKKHSAGTIIEDKYWGRETDENVEMFVLFNYPTTNALPHQFRRDWALGLSEAERAELPGDIYADLIDEDEIPALSSMSPFAVVMRYADGRQFYYDIPGGGMSQGHIIYEDGNWRNNVPMSNPHYVDDFLKLTWADSKLLSIAAPPSDGRKLEMEFNNNHGCISSISLTHGSESHCLVRYAYKEDESLSKHVQLGDTVPYRLYRVTNPAGTIGRQYDYGQFNPVDSSVTNQLTYWDSSGTSAVEAYWDLYYAKLCRESLFYLENGAETIIPITGTTYHYDEDPQAVKTVSQWELDPRDSKYKMSLWLKDQVCYYGAQTEYMEGMDIGSYFVESVPCYDVETGVEVSRLPACSCLGGCSAISVENGYFFICRAGTQCGGNASSLALPYSYYSNGVMYYERCGPMPRQKENFIGTTSLVSQVDLFYQGHWVKRKATAYRHPEEGINEPTQIVEYVDEGGQNGLVTTFGYESAASQARLLNVINPDHTEQLFTYDDVTSDLKKIEYRRNGQTIRWTDALYYQYSESPAKVGLIKTLTMTAADGETHQVTFDYYTDTNVATGHLAGSPSTITNETESVSFKYNLFGQVTELTNRFGTYQYSYSGGDAQSGAMPYLESTTTPDDTTTIYVHDPRGRLIQTQAYYDGVPKPRMVNYGYDVRNNLTLITSTDGKSAGYVYDSYGQMVQMTDGNGNAHTYTYDEFGRVTGTAENGQWTRYEYAGIMDACNGDHKTIKNVVMTSNKKGSVIHYNYDLAGRLLGMTPISFDHPYAAPVSGYVYNNENQLTATYNGWSYPAAAPEYTFNYDDLGRMSKITYPNQRSIDLVWNEGDKLKQTTDPFGFITRYEYDTKGQIKTLDHSTLSTATLERNLYQDLQQLCFSNKTKSVMSYNTSDPFGRLTGINIVSEAMGSAQTLQGQNWSYDPFGRKEHGGVNMPTRPDISQWNIAYNDSDEVVGEHLEGQGGFSRGYQYDKLWNRTTVSDGHSAASLTYDSANREKSNSSGKSVQTYDFAGNVLTRATLADPAQSYTYYWDALNHLRVAHTGNDANGAACFDYDSLGQLVFRRKYTATYSAKRYYWLGMERLVEENTKSNDLAGITPIVRLDQIGQPWRAYGPSGATPVSTVNDDERGSVLQLQSAINTDGSFALGYSTGMGEEGISSAPPLAIVPPRTYVGLWIKSGTPHAPMVVAAVVNTDKGERKLVWKLAETEEGGASGKSDDCATQVLAAPEDGCNWLDGKWHYLELDVAGMLQKNFSDATLTTLDALIVRGRTVYLDDPVVSDGYLDKTYLVLPGAPVGGVLAAQAGPLAAETRTKAGGHDRWWYHTNELGTVMATTDYTGQPIGVYFPDSLGNYPYGTTTGIRPDGLGLSGKLFDEDAGAYYYGARWLDPDRGRWLSQEPLGFDGPNLYHFGFNDMSNGYDVWGLKWNGPPPEGGGKAYWGTGDDDYMWIPPSVDLIEHLREASRMGPFAFRDAVRNHGRWDYKQCDKAYADFGNFHYGYTGYAAGFPLKTLLINAGRAQILAGTSNPNWGKPGNMFGWGGVPPYGDDPNDQEFIEMGYRAAVIFWSRETGGPR